MSDALMRDTLNSVIDLFPSHVKEGEILPRIGFYREILKTILPRITEKCAKVLDVGAAGGICCMVLQRMGCNVSAVDIWERYTDIKEIADEEQSHRERLVSNGVSTFCCDVEREDLPFEDNSVDIVLCTELVEHLHCSPKRVMREMFRVLKPKGILVITTPNLANLKNRIMVLFGHSNHTPLSIWYIEEHYSSHIREYTSGELKKMLRWEGFQIRRMRYTNLLEAPMLKPLRPRSLLVALYILSTAIIPQIRYTLMYEAQKG